MRSDERARLIEHLQEPLVSRLWIRYQLPTIIANLKRVDVLEKALREIMTTSGETPGECTYDHYSMAKDALGDA